MAYLKWENDQLHVLIPPKQAQDAFRQLDLRNDPLLAALLPHASGVKFEISALFGAAGAAGNTTPQFQTLAASLPLEEALELARWILESIEEDPSPAPQETRPFSSPAL